MQKAILPRLVAAIAIILALALPALAREEIRAFASDVTLRIDASVRVVETIDVNAEGNNIRRGIYRDIPVTMIGPSGNKIRISLDVESVTRKGKPEMFRVERMGDFQRIWIGDPDVLLSVGQHRYAIAYTMDRMVRPSADGDELYWNATGNYWDFPVLESVARVTLPERAVIGDLAAYTGDVGSTERAVTVTRESDRSAIFRTRRALGPGEGMSFAVSFQKGVVTYPEGVDALLTTASDLRDVWLPVLAVVLLLVYNFAAWLRVGRDPPKGTIIPLFHPPKGFSPALAHYVHNWGFANGGWTAMTAAIFDLGVKGLVTIENPAKTLTVRATSKQPEEALPPGEQVLHSYFAGRGAVTFNRENGTELAAKRAEFTNTIQSENRQVWFRKNTGFAVISFVLAAAMIGIMVWLDVLDVVWLVGAVASGIFIGVGGSLLLNVIKTGHWVHKLVLGGGGAIFLTNFGLGLLDSFTGIQVNSAAIAAGSLVLISIIFAILMRAPTVQGRKVMDEIEGFKLYMDTAEKNRLNISGEPPMTVERFERILPYAIALGVEKPWSEHFEAELARNAVSDARGSYAPIWYSGRSGSFSTDNIARSISTASSGMAAAMIAAQPVQSSSSGSSGGGFSGGGGGGGGGGGW